MSDSKKLWAKLTVSHRCVPAHLQLNYFLFFFSGLRMLYAYTPDHKFDSIRISVLSDITKILKKSTTLKMSITFILHNNGVKLLINW